MRRLTILAGLIFAGTVAVAMPASVADTFPTPGALKWGPAPPVFAPGAKMAVLAGDPTKSGDFTVRLSMPSGYRIMPHYHPTVENVTVISGVFHVGMGDTFDKSKATAFVAGGFGTIPATMHHWAWASGRTIVQVQGPGPFQLLYVNPADMPKAH